MMPGGVESGWRSRGMSSGLNCSVLNKPLTNSALLRHGDTRQDQDKSNLAKFGSSFKNAKGSAIGSLANAAYPGVLLKVNLR